MNVNVTQTDFDSAIALARTGPTELGGVISPDWNANHGPHGGYLAAMVLHGLQLELDDPERAPRSLTIHFLSKPTPGPVTLHTAVERKGRSLATLSGRLQQGSETIALALAAFSPPWGGQDFDDAPMPDVQPPAPERTMPQEALDLMPPFGRHFVMQSRVGEPPFAAAERDAPMTAGGWLGLAQPRATDALSVAMFSDVWFPSPYVRLQRPAATPTIVLSVYFRTPLPRADPDPHELCLVRFNSTLVREGFYEEDGVIWGADGTLLAQSRQLGIVLPG
ncbi:MAG TPA: thioesterase family protein [Solirubrobacteraceae bacterium]|nr:thioesterase family protein [Solirubrobacteraceae bacterium]